MSKKLPHVPKAAKKILLLAGQMIAFARKEQKWRQIDLADRVGVTRQTVARMFK